LTAAAGFVCKAGLTLERGVTAGADNLHNTLQDFKIFGWRDPAQGFPVNHYPILK
jgi:hypothetical protein